jgi:hypothetical protein
MMHAPGAWEASLASGRVVERPELLASFEEPNSPVGLPDVQTLERRFLTPAQLAAGCRRG